MDREISEMAQEIESQMNPDVMDDDELQGIVGKEIDDAIDYIDNWISPLRAKATEYYRGQPFGDEEDGRSQVVSMDVRDTVQAILPSLMRIFNSTERTVEFMPQQPDEFIREGYYKRPDGSVYQIGTGSTPEDLEAILRRMGGN